MVACCHLPSDPPTSVQAFLARLQPRFAVQLLAVVEAVQSSLLLLSLRSCKPDDTSHFTARVYLTTTVGSIRVQNNTTLIACEYGSKQHDQASLDAKLSSARALLTVTSASRPAVFPVTRSSTKESPEPHFCLREPPCRPCNNVRAPTGRSSSQQQAFSLCSLHSTTTVLDC